MKKALSAKFTSQTLSGKFASQCRVIKEIIPWKEVEKKLINKN